MLSYVTIAFENRENMPRVAIIESVVAFDENDDEIEEFPELSGVDFFGEDGQTQAIQYVAEQLHISADLISLSNDAWEE